MSDETVALQTFTDKHGKAWTPKVTLRAVAEFERRTGIGLFEAVFQTLSETPSEDKVSLQRMSGLVSGFFGKLEHLTYFLWESCRYEAERILGDSGDGPMTFDDFADRIEGPQLFEAVACAINALVAFFPEPRPEEEEEEDDDKPDPPMRGRIPGATSTK